jgi:serine/threonine protein kinase
LNEYESIKLGDFGNSRSINEDSTSNISTFTGTYKYMSPEMREFKKYSYNTDCWSAGCCLFELITLEKYFDYINGNKNVSISLTKTPKIHRILIKKLNFINYV